MKINASFKYVSRAGYKIEAIFLKLGLESGGKSVLDVGCSTGGFLDFFLQQDAAKVVGLDMARDISPLRGGAKNRGTMEMVYVLGAK